MGQHLQYPGPRVYLYRAAVLSVTDGDTVLVGLDVGFDQAALAELRLRRINAREIKSTDRAVREQAHRDREHLEQLIARYSLPQTYDRPTVEVQTFKNSRGNDVRTFTRYVAELWGRDGAGQPINLNELMIADGSAVWDLDHPGI